MANLSVFELLLEYFQVYMTVSQSEPQVLPLVASVPQESVSAPVLHFFELLLRVSAFESALTCLV